MERVLEHRAEVEERRKANGKIKDGKTPLEAQRRLADAEEEQEQDFALCSRRQREMQRLEVCVLS